MYAFGMDCVYWLHVLGLVYVAISSVFVPQYPGALLYSITALVAGFVLRAVLERHMDIIRDCAKQADTSRIVEAAMPATACAILCFCGFCTAWFFKEVATRHASLCFLCLVVASWWLISGYFTKFYAEAHPDASYPPAP